MKAFSIPEVFEMILLEMRIYDLFAQQRTCKLFKRNIEGSSKVQQKMFLKASPCSGSYVEDINPIFRDFSLNLDHTSKVANDSRPTSMLGRDNKIALEYARCDHPQSHLRGVSKHWMTNMPSTSILWTGCQAASWRRMLASRRMAGNFGVRLRLDDQHRPRQGYLKFFPKETLVGDVFDTLDGQYNGFLRGSFAELSMKDIARMSMNHGESFGILEWSTEDDG